MGNASALPLHAQPQFPRVIHPRFVNHTRMVSLLLDDQFFLPSNSQGSPLSEIRDADSGAVVFMVQRPSPNQKKLLLMDSNGVATAALEGFPVESQLAIYEVTNPLSSVARQTTTPPLVRMDTNFRVAAKRVIVDLFDRRGGRTRVYCQRRWERHDAWLCIDRKGSTTETQYIVRVLPVKLTPEEKSKRKSQGIKSKPYKVSIVPGIDAACVVLVCAALDLELAKKDEPFQPTEEDLARLAERPLHEMMQRLEKLGLGSEANDAVEE